MARPTWLIDVKSLARKVTNATGSSSQQIKDYGASRECPSCHYLIDNSDVSHEWPGMPAGIKFDPTDVQLLEHLEAKCGVGNEEPHMFITEFIPTLEEGINYTHPENLPGARKDGSSVHFFHKTTNAYGKGQRKRRKIDKQNTSNEELVRWHKTGKTRSVMVNGVHKGWKKIMVLYKTSKKSKPNKSNWVMHQYHLGPEEDEKGGVYVVSKVLYHQTRQSDKTDDSPITEDPSTSTHQTSPRTPKPTLPDPPRAGKSAMCDDIADDYIPQSSDLESEYNAEDYASQLAFDLGVDMDWLAGESQPVESNLNYLYDPLLCGENISSSSRIDNSDINNISSTDFAQNRHEVTANTGASHEFSELENTNEVTANSKASIADLENLELDTPPDFQGDPQLAIDLGDDNTGYSAWLEGNSQAFESYKYDSWLLNNNTNSSSGAFPGIHELENLELGALSDEDIDNLQYDSQDSMFGDTDNYQELL